MKKVADLLRGRIYERCGVVETATDCSVEMLAMTERDKEFERLQRNRLIVGALRYWKL